MLQYLVILLDDTAPAFCHADNPLSERFLMPEETLRRALLFGMKENMMVQFVYPDYELPDGHRCLIESVESVKIGRDISVYNGVPEKIETSAAVVRLSIEDLIAGAQQIAGLLPQTQNLNICLTDIHNFRDEQAEAYSKALSILNAELLQLFRSGQPHRINILTDRLQLKEMHNCGAGVTNITLAPNGKFYLCPAFYYDERTGLSNRMNHANPSSSRSEGDLVNGLQIPNQQLLQLNHAPLCRICDAYHCNRCIWLNNRLTWDNNTPSRQQCVLAHLERNASRDLQQQLKAAGMDGGEEIKHIDYIDPFDVRVQF
ncbi:MAG: CXXX repeat peptide maturase [Paludibacteraceae bacterium]|nr:CXXX repeat peptide maturase [Paludibacteraceae bacterium]